MSATDDQDGTKSPKKVPEDKTETTSATGTEAGDAGTSESDGAAVEKKPAALTATRTDRQASRKSPDAAADKKKNAAPKSGAAKPPKDAPAKTTRRRSLGLVAALLVILLLGGPALFLLCLSESGGPLDVTVSPTGSAVSCPRIAGHFDDCYLSEEITVSAPAPAPKDGLEQFCCDFIVERTMLPTASYRDGSGNLPPTLAAEGTALPLTDGTRRTGSPVLQSGDGSLVRKIRIVAEPVFTVPALNGLGSLLGRPVAFDVTPMIAAVAPKAAARAEHERDIHLTEGGTMVRLSNGTDDPTQISIRARTTPTLIFAEILAGGTAPERILTVPGILPKAASGWLPRQIDNLAPAGHGEIRAAYSALQQTSVSRLAASAEADSGLRDAGRACIGFYGAMRERFSRYDAAVATFIAAGPTGLLTSLSPADPHGCSDPANPALSADLAADWTALNAPFVTLEIPKADPAEETASAAADGEAVVRKVLLDFASAAKSGARLQDIKASMSDPVAIRFGRDGVQTSGSRDAVIRMLYRQWSHVGCWIYAARDSGGSAMLLAEAQYPYLNRIVLDFDGSGRITKVEVTGVTFDDLLRFKAANRGSECQNFLNPVRLADYRDWYAVNPVGAATPADHAERLFHEGLQQKFRLN